MPSIGMYHMMLRRAGAVYDMTKTCSTDQDRRASAETIRVESPLSQDPQRTAIQYYMYLFPRLYYAFSLARRSSSFPCFAIGFFSLQCIFPHRKLLIDDYARFNTRSFWIYLCYLGCIFGFLFVARTLTKEIPSNTLMTMPSCDLP